VIAVDARGAGSDHGPTPYGPEAPAATGAETSRAPSIHLTNYFRFLIAKEKKSRIWTITTPEEVE